MQQICTDLSVEICSICVICVLLPEVKTVFTPYNPDSYRDRETPWLKKKFPADHADSNPADSTLISFVNSKIKTKS